jgi:hypothetical protein
VRSGDTVAVVSPSFGAYQDSLGLRLRVMPSRAQRRLDLGPARGSRGRVDWNERADVSRPRELRPSEGWIELREGTATGPLPGGCLETICWHPKGSSEWLDPAGAILFLETSEGPRLRPRSTRT